jgi:hypothetical protein
MGATSLKPAIDAEIFSVQFATLAAVSRDNGAASYAGMESQSPSACARDAERRSRNGAGRNGAAIPVVFELIVTA